MESGATQQGKWAKLSPGAPGAPAAFGPYLLYGLIARGGMAEVYRARRADGQGDLLAIKVMRPQLLREARFVDMFIREGRLATLLGSDAVVRTVEVGEVAGRYFIAMEYIAGKDLTQVLRRCHETGQRLPVPHAIAIAAAISAGLECAHTVTDSEGRALNIVNRDVSPSNVRVGYDGRVRLLDFGIAQAMLKLTSEIGVLKGKFSYMSPEQIRGLPVDARTDLFSTGSILHEMLTTEKVFRGDSEFALMEKVRKAEVLPPSRFNRRVSPELDRICLKALARDPEQRYQRAAELRAELVALLEGYRFEVGELAELMGRLFREEVEREEAELRECTVSGRPRSDGLAAGVIVVEPGGGRGRLFDEGRDESSVVVIDDSDAEALVVSSQPRGAAAQAGAGGLPSAPGVVAGPTGQGERLGDGRLAVGAGDRAGDGAGGGAGVGGGLWSRLKRSLSR